MGEHRRRAVRTLIVRILIYSDINRSANLEALYSTLKPETSSDSPSAKSKGVRWSSARIDVSQIRANGKNRKIRGEEEKERIEFISNELQGITSKISNKAREIS